MPSVEVQRRSTEGPHLILYDGVCGLCNALIRAVLERDRLGLFHFASLQSAAARNALGPFGAKPDDLTTFYLVANYRTTTTTLLTKGRAAMFVITRLGWPWKAAGLLGVLPGAVLDRAYDFVARNRYRVLDRGELCLMPRPEYLGRFIDSSTGVRSESSGSMKIAIPGASSNVRTGPTAP